MADLRAPSGATSEPDLELLENIGRGMAITADLSRSDLLLVIPRNPDQVLVVAQAQPHSIHSLYDGSIVGKCLSRQDAPALFETWRRGRPARFQRELVPTGAPIAHNVYPARGESGRLLALFSIETSMIQLERHRQRHPAFRRAIEWLKMMCMRGELAGAEGLTPFGEWDGVMLVDRQRRITYLSGIANNLYRRLGYMEDLRGRRLSYLNTLDDDLAKAAISARKPLQHEVDEGSRLWIRKALPVWAPPTFTGRVRRAISQQGRPGNVDGVLILVHDATEERRKKQELDVKTTMIQEVHHRVKNNLQTIAATLRMQARRSSSPEALQALHEAMTRILSVAVIHEFLSRDERQYINIRDVCQRIVGQSRQVATTPAQRITFEVEGPAIYLPSQQATACALVINELIQNAVEHGFEKRKVGRVRIALTDGGDRVHMEVLDNGDPLPPGFVLGESSSLGLQIVRTLVQSDLNGEVTLENRGQEVTATVEFPKAAPP